jgi:hypothetical protein
MNRRVVLIGFASVAMLSFAVHAVAEPTPGKPPPPTPSATASSTVGPVPGQGEDEGALISKEEALLQDAQEFARQKGVSQVDALASMTNQPAREKFIHGIQSSAGDRLAGAWIEPELGRVVVRLTGTDTDRVKQAAKTVTFPVVIKTGAASTLDNKTKMLQDPVLRSWIASNKSIVGVGIDEKADGLRLDVTGSAVAVPVKVKAVLDKYNLAVKMDVTDSRFEDFDRGGRNMTSCTAGFVYKAPTGPRIVLAGHCGSQSFYYFNGNGPYGTGFKGEKWDWYADLQWRDSSVVDMKPYFFSQAHPSPISRRQEGEGTAAVGSFLCFRGKRSDRKCGTVDDITYAPTWPGACRVGYCYATFVRMDMEGTDSGQPGDSGGPVYNGQRAYGIVKGGSTSAGTVVYSKLSYLPSNLLFWPTPE